MLEKCVLTIQELNWSQRLGHRKTKFNICHHMLTSSTHLLNWSFHVVERTRTSTKRQKMKNARAKRAKILFFIVKYANLWGFCCRRRRVCLSSLLANPHNHLNAMVAFSMLAIMKTSVHYNSACISLFAVLDLSEETTYKILSALFYFLCRKCSQLSFVFTLGKLKIGQIAKIKYK